MVQTNTLLPVPKLVTVVVGELGVVIVPEPEDNIHIPVPVVGVFAAMIVFGLLIQIV